MALALVAQGFTSTAKNRRAHTEGHSREQCAKFSLATSVGIDRPLLALQHDKWLSLLSSEPSLV
jgi:hypothetical protein